MRVRGIVFLFYIVLLVFLTPLLASAAWEELGRFDRITTGADVPTDGCVPYKALHIQQPSGQLLFCSSDQLTYTPFTSTGGGGSVVGIVSSPSGVDSIHYNTISLTNTCGVLGSVSHVNVAAASGGTTCTLPDASLFSTPGNYSIVVTNANRLSLAPSGTNLLNGSNAPLASILGPRAKFKVERRSATEWYAEVIASVGYGEPVLNVCAERNGSTNTSSSGSGSWHTHTKNCLIPANALKAQTTLRVCVGEQVSTGSAPPTASWRLLANSTVLIGNKSPTPMTYDIVTNTVGMCFVVVVGNNPSATADVYTVLSTDFNGVNYDIVASGIANPVAVDTTVDIVLGWETKWTTAGTGTNTRKQQLFTVEGSRFAN